MISTLDQMRRDIRDCLQKAGFTNADNQARWLLTARTGYNLNDIIVRPDQKLDSHYIQTLKHDCRELSTGKPLARVLGYAEFYGLAFGVNASTLEPRPDTEILVDAVRTWRRNHPHYDRDGFTFVDLGTGSGCILTSLLHYWPDCRGLGIDNSESALRQARDNAALNDVIERCDFVCGNWLDSLCERFPLLLANPPYVPSADIESLDESVQRFDPFHALDGGTDGLCSIESLVSIANQNLTEDGAAFFEIGYDQLDDVVRLIDSSDVNLVGVHHDLGGIPRVVEICRGDNSKKN
jgi:release factor glutamine methyltransferase